ncbi:M14 family zinc carboxypeptidase [Aureisphaera galaxeae]|uniref:M14 family metallopeptidase n=1 Tax=Aureisphaera galaxeae TaxID=1538023 RepID=UPI002350CF30|nr:M14 family metallopeptidase [Aureisphaera galaxeae]MDC8003607.1 M14 family zinc carboxypeptidase [Aureisphaera galaxeae]
MKKLLLTTLLLISALGFSQDVREIYQRAKISFNQPDDLSRLAALDIPVEHGIHKKGHFVINEFSVSELDRARANGFQVEVLIEDATAHFLKQNETLGMAPRSSNPSCDDAAGDYQTPANFHQGTMGGYFTYQEMLNELDEMRAAYPNLITAKENIHNFLTEGQPDPSTTPPIGGNGIKWVRISDNADTSNEGEPKILYTAIHHAREPASLSQLIFYMWYLLENYDSDPEIQSIVDNTELYFVPVVNPDGYLYNQKTDPNGGGFWRKNRKGGHGVDNNRNYDYYIDGNPSNGVWGGEGTSSDPNSDVYHGAAPFSEVENQAMRWMVENHDFVMAFNNHTSGNLLLYPYGYTDNVPTPEDALFQGVSAELVSRNGFANMISADLYPAAGDSDDFMYGTVGTHNSVYAFTPEIGPSFWPAASQIESICKSMMYLNLTSAKMVNNYAAVTDTGSQYIGDNTNVDATFDIHRLGLSGSGDFTVSLNPVSANITSAGSPVNFTGMQTLDTDNGSISYTLDASTQSGDDVVYELVVNNGAYDNIITVSKKFGSLVAIFQDPGDSTTDNFDNNGWSTTTTTYVSPTSSITESPSGNYQNNANETITLSDPIDLTNAAGANVTFYARWDIENNWDYAQFEVSTDGGSTWEPQCGKFTNAGSDNGFQPEGEPLYDGTQIPWVFEEIDLSDYLGENILVRFEFRSDGGVRDDGFYFDDLQINVIDDGTLAIGDNTTSAFSIYPNPVEDILSITTPLQNYTVEIFNLQGQLVSREKNNNGSKVLDYSNYATGVYLLKLSSEDTVQTFKIVRL